MRTTVTLEPALAKEVKVLAHRRGQSFKQTLNELIRRGLTTPAHAEAPPPFAIQPHHGGFLPGIDHGKLNRLADELEVEDFIAEARS